MQKLKRVVIKEELVALTGDAIKAVLLNQFIYWSERIRDFDRFITEEKVRAEAHGESITMPPAQGWIYKSAEELADETMLGMADTTIRRHLKSLIEMGYLEERRNPRYQWDRTMQYRVNLVKIQKDLLDLGFPLEGYTIVLPSCKTQDRNCTAQDGDCKTQVQSSQNAGAIPETTTEITTSTTRRDIQQAESASALETIDEAIELYPRYSDDGKKLIARYWDTVRWTRKTGMISPNIVAREMEYWERFDVQTVREALDIHLERCQNKPEDYTRGIMRRLIRERATTAKPAGQATRRARSAEDTMAELERDRQKRAELLGRQ